MEAACEECNANQWQAGADEPRSVSCPVRRLAASSTDDDECAERDVVELALPSRQFRRCSACGDGLHCPKQACMASHVRRHIPELCARKQMAHLLALLRRRRARLAGAGLDGLVTYLECSGADRGLSLDSYATRVEGETSAWSWFFGLPTQVPTAPVDWVRPDAGPELARLLATGCLHHPLTVFHAVATVVARASSVGSNDDRKAGDCKVARYLAARWQTPAVSSTLTIHVVGAAVAESNAAPTWEHLLHLLPSVRELRLVLVGPEASDHLPDGSVRWVEGDAACDEGLRSARACLHLCEACVAEGRSVHVQVVSGVYEDYLDKIAASPPTVQSTGADVMVAFNSGVHSAEEDWAAAFQRALHGGLRCGPAAVLLTSYSAEEARADAAVLARLGGRVVVEPSLNPFRSLEENVATVEEGGLFCSSWYWTLFEGSNLT